jgi:hypothetical protein
MKLRVAIPARLEMVEATRYYERERFGLGLEFREAITKVLDAIERHPRHFSRVEWPRVVAVEVRRLRLRRFPYLIIYQIVNEMVLVIACMHVRRRPGYWKRRIQREPQDE